MVNAPPIPQNGGVKKKKETKSKQRVQGSSSINRLVDLEDGIILPLSTSHNNRVSITGASTGNNAGKKSTTSSFYQSNFSSEVGQGL